MRAEIPAKTRQARVDDDDQTRTTSTPRLEQQQQEETTKTTTATAVEASTTTTIAAANQRKGFSALLHQRRQQQQQQQSQPGKPLEASKPSAAASATRDCDSDTLSIVKTQLVFLLSTLSEDNLAAHRAEIAQHCQRFGSELHVALLAKLLDARKNGASHPALASLLALEVKSCSQNPQSASSFAKALQRSSSPCVEDLQCCDHLDALEALSLLWPLAATESCNQLAVQWAAKISSSGMNSQPAAPPDGGGGAGSAVLGAALHALRPSATGPLSPTQLSVFLQQLVSDGEGSDAPVLGRTQRRALVSSAAERVGPDAFSRALIEALSNYRIKKSLPGFLADLGPAGLPNVETVRAVFGRFGLTESSPPDEHAVAHLFAGLLAEPPYDVDRADVPRDNVTNWAVLVRAISSLRQITWPRAIRALDDLEGFQPSSIADWSGFASALLATQAVSGLWGPWNQKLLQLNILSGLLNLDGETFSFAAVPGRRIVTSADVARASTTIRQLVVSCERATWNSLDLVETLALLAAEPQQSEPQPDVKKVVTYLLERFIKESPELLLCGLVQIPEPWNPIHMELAQKLMSMFLSSAPGHQLVFHLSYQTNRNFVLQSLVRSYLNSPANITRIVDVAQDLKALPALLEVRADPAKPFFFALDVAALASRREILNADLFLERLIHEHGTTFMRATLDFLSEKLKEELALQEQDSQQQQQFVAPSVQTVATFLRRLRTHGESMSAEDIEAFKMVRNLALQLHPRLLPIRQSESQEPGMEVASFAQEIHEECDETFGRMYKQELSVEDVVAILQRLKHSERNQDTELFACMVHTLFDEQRYIKSYPPTELRLTAHLFGDLIQFSLIDYVALGIAIRGCLDALRTQPGSPMFEFGLEALKRFQGRLQDWPQLAQALQALPPHPEVTAILNRAAQAPVTSEAVTNGADRPAFTAVDPGAEPFGSEDQVEPDEEASDKVLFAINNLSPSNLEGKLADIRNVLTSRIFRWFAHYLTLERCQLEPNFHGLYLRFLQAVGDAKLDAYVLRETLALAQRLINSESTVSTLQSRKALQNIGSWLGLITLARDRPIRFKNIDFKLLLLEGYDSGRLIVAVPFVAKVLEQCSKSRVFKLPNPWLNAVLRVLAELYQLPELKLNLRFEIEVLCKSLGVDLKDIQPSSIIRTRTLPHQQLEQRLDQPPADMVRPPQQQQQHEQAVQAAQAATAASNAYTESLTQMLQNLPHYIQINNGQLAQPAIKRLIYVAIDRGIRDIVAPVVERSVTIASITARELVVKDFAMEGDEAKMRDSAHQMAANLAGSLALATCKEPLRASMLGNARTLFLQSGFTEQSFPEAAVVGIMQDNLDLACSVVEKAAMDKAMPEVDEALSSAYNARREHRQRGRGHFWDAGALTTSQYANTLPDGLRLRHEGLQPQQLRVYQDFGNFARAPEDERQGRALIGDAGVDAAGYDDVSSNTPTAYTAQQSLEKFSQCVAEIEQLLAREGPDAGITTLPQGHELRDVVRQVPVIASQSMNRDEAALAFSQKVVQLLFKSETGLARDVYVILLERLCEVSLKVAKEVTAWLVYAEDERKFNVPVTVSLLRAGLMNIAETDVQLTKLIMRDFKPSMVDFAAKLALECLRDPPCATRGQLANIIEALGRAAQQGKATSTATQFLEELDALKSSKTDVSNAALREQLSFCFAEWVRLFQHSPNAEKSFIDFVTQLQGQGILKGEEISSMFIRVCTEVGVDSYIKQKAAGGSLATGIFSPVDAFSKMVVLMIKYHSDPAGVNHDQAKVHYLTKILSIVVLVLAQSHEELGPHFQQKPFFRFFSSLLHDLHVTESSLQTTYLQSLLAISNTLNTLQPSFFPGFTFSWMSLISHRLFMPKLLANRQHGWAAFHRLFCSLLRFLAPILRKAELQETSRSLYRGTLRIFLVLLHDFPDFLSAYHHTLLDLIPYTCTQMRNLVLSAFPRDRRLPDPFAPNLRIERLAEVSTPPLVLSDYEAALPAELKSALAIWGQSRSPASFPATLKEVLLLRGGREGDGDEVDELSWEPRYNVAMVNSLVLSSAISTLSSPNNILTGNVENDATLALLRGLTKHLDPEGIYLVLSACANQLRYPSSHSAYFSLAILHIFGHAETTDEIRGQVLRVLLERIVVNRPHPWALLMSVFELLRGHGQGRYTMPPGMPAEIEGLLDHIRGGLGAGAGAALAGAGAGAAGPGVGMGADVQQQQQQQAQAQGTSSPSPQPQAPQA